LLGAGKLVVERRDLLQAAVAAYMKSLGVKGGAARAKKMTKEERSESARKAAQARWAKKD